MRRRTLLALTGSSVAGFAGCLGGTRSDGTTDTSAETETTTDSSGTTEETPVDADVSVAVDALQPGMVTMNSPDSIGVYPRDGQYFLLDVTAEGSAPPVKDDFAFRLGETTRTPVAAEQRWRIWRFHGSEDWQCDGDSGDGLLLFELPESVEVEADGASPEAALTWPGGEWQPDEELRRRLATPTPPLSVSVEVPDEITASERPTITVTVENDGDVPGQFVAGLNRSGPMVAHMPVSRVSVLAPAGETETWELDDDSIMGDGDGKSNMTYYLDWGDERVERGVQYAQTPASTTDTA